MAEKLKRSPSVKGYRISFMSDILSKLKSLGVTKGMPAVPKAPSQNPMDQIDLLLKAFPNGIVTENDCGYAFINRLVQPLDKPHGSVNMNCNLLPSPLFDSILEMEIKTKEDTLAFDTETSGLSAGSGSFISMIGLGYFDNNNYIVDQLILPDLSSETAFLRQTELIFSRFPILLSYNGKSFDIPMLQNRIHFHMFPDFTKDIKHCDLLKISRRYWKPTLGSVRLSNIEQYLLKLQRGEEEVPGALAPELYRNYLRDSDASHISGVAYHNQIDVISLSAFLLYINDIVKKAETDPVVWKENRVSESALMRYNLSVFSGKVIKELDQFGVKEKKSMAAKFMKSRDTDKALEILENLASDGDWDAAERLTNYYFKNKNTERFEYYRKLCINVLEHDSTIGKWTKEDKIAKLNAMTLNDKFK